MPKSVAGPRHLLKSCVAVLLLIALGAANARAWGGLGHRTVAVIADLAAEETSI